MHWLSWNTRCNRVGYIYGYLAGVTAFSMLPLTVLVLPSIGRIAVLSGLSFSLACFCLWLLQTRRRLNDGQRSALWLLPLAVVGFAIPGVGLLFGWLMFLAVAPESNDAARALSLPALFAALMTLAVPFLFRTKLPETTDDAMR